MGYAAVKINDLRKSYSCGVTALQGISLEVAEGDFFALLGPNGAGKSTTIGILCSLVAKTSGNVSIFGIDIDKNFNRAKQLLGVVPQEFNFNQFEKVIDVVMTQAGYYGLSRHQAQGKAEYYLKALGLWEKRYTVSRSLSGGMKRRLMIARALVHEPRLLILDEPTAGVDIELRRSMWDFLTELNAKGTTVILTTHYLEEAESLCRNVAIIDQGCIVENTSMRALLDQLDQQSFLFDLQEPLAVVPILKDFSYQLVDPQTLEINLGHGQSLNDVFERLNQVNIRVRSMKNKSNRLEALFISRVQPTL